MKVSENLCHYHEVLEKISNYSSRISVEVYDGIQYGLKNCLSLDRERYYYLLGRYYLLNLEFDKAIAELSKIKNSKFNEDFYTESQHYLGKAYYLKHQIHIALGYLYNVYNTERGQEGSYFYYVTKFIEGQCYAEMKLFQEAILVFDHLIEEKNKAPISAVFGSCIMSGNVYKYLEKYDEGLAILKKAEQIYTAYSNELPPNAYANLYKHKADLLRNKNKYDEAYAIYSEILAKGELQLGDKVSVLNAKAICCGFLGKYAQAEEIWQNMLNDTSINSNPYLLVTIKMGLSDISSEQGNDILAQELLLSLSDHIGKIESERMVLSYYQKVYDLSKKLNNVSKALSCLEKTYDLEIAINKKELYRQVEAVKAINQLENSKKDNEIMKKEIEINKQKLDMSLVLLKQKNTMLDEIDDFVSALRKDNIQKGKLYTEIHNKIKSAKKANIHEAEVEIKLNESLHEYTKKLREKYKEITHTEANVAWYLTKGMNTKEIAELMVKEAKTIEQYRYRLRQKLGLTRGEDLELALSSV